MLKGSVVYTAPAYLVVDVNGVGYQVYVSTHTVALLPSTGNVILHIETVVREDAITMFGFATRQEKEFFTVLTNVSGVGPKLAVSLLSIGLENLVMALLHEDPVTLTSISGVGKKTAERLILELKEKAVLFGDAEEVVPGAGLAEEVVSVLVNLGYDKKNSMIAVKKLDLKGKGITLEESIKEALKLMGRK